MAGKPGAEGFAEYPDCDCDAGRELVAAVRGHQFAEQDELAGNSQAADGEKGEGGREKGERRKGEGSGLWVMEGVALAES